MRVGLIGLGVVGSATSRFLAGQHDIVEYDQKWGEEYPAEQLRSCDLALICVDSPHVWTALHALPAEKVLIRTTLRPGEAEQMADATHKRIGYWPAFIGESKGHPWPEEAAVPFAVLGANTELWLTCELLFPNWPARREILCSVAEAELIKLAINSFLATKIAFANELFDICQSLGVDYGQVRDGWAADPRIGSSHTRVTTERGFGGKCLPRDLATLIEAADSSVGTPLLEAVRRRAR